MKIMIQKCLDKFFVVNSLICFGCLLIFPIVCVHHSAIVDQQQIPSPPLPSLSSNLNNETTTSPIWYLDGTSSSYLQFQSWKHFFYRKNINDDDEQKEELSNQDQASISFEFRYQLDQSTLSRPLGGLLLYTDDEQGIGGRFLEIKLLSDTQLRLRIDDNSMIRTKNLIELKQQQINFTDGQWHRLELIHHYQLPIVNENNHNNNFINENVMINYDEHFETITLKIDSETYRKNLELSTNRIGYGGLQTKHQSKSANDDECHHKHKAVFIGGIPEEYRQQNLAHLALPTVAYELHFRGAIRNVQYSYRNKINHLDDNQQSKIIVQQQLPVASYGLFGEYFNSKHDLECDPIQDRCKHGGYCYTTNNGVYCDCSITDFDGTYCQNEKRLAEATFHGNLGEYLGYNYMDLPNAWSLISIRESFELSFRTKIANGLLLLTSDEYEDYLAITIRDAGLTLTMKLGSNVHEKTIKPSKVRFDDNQWHTVLVWRRIREISPSTYFCHFSISVDGIYTQYGSTASPISYLISKVFYVGGIAHNSAVETSNPITTSSNFVGCLRKTILTADNVRLDLLEILQNDNYNYDTKQQQQQESTILQKDWQSDSLIRLYGGNHSLSSMICEDVDISDPITFTTSESYLKLNGWNSPKEGTLSLKIRTNEPNGVLIYSDGKPDKNSTRDYFALELLDGHLYLLMNLGSAPVKVKATNKRIDDSHWHMITVRRSERNGQVVVDETISDFVSPGQSNRLDLSDSIYLGGIPLFSGQRSTTTTYTPPELWSSSIGYGYIGCVKDLYLNDHIIDIATLTKRQDSGSIRPSCHSLSSQCSNSPCQNDGHCIEGWNRYYCDCTETSYTGSVCTKNAAIVSFNGEQYITILLPEELQTQAESLSLRFKTNKPNGLLLTTSHSYLDDHFMILSLESGSIRLDFNYGDQQMMERIIMIDQKLNDNQWHTIHLERRGPNIEISIDQKTKQVIELTGQHFTLQISAIHIGARLNIHKSRQKKHFTGFIGQMQNFVFNGQQYFEKIRDGQLPNGSIRITAKLGKKDRILHNAVTFKSKYTFVGLPQLKAYSRLNVYFQFKTREPNGLLLFNGGGQKHDFIAVEMVNGNIHYIFDLGDGPRRLQSNNRQSLNDNHWHTVTLGRPSLYQHTMLIDDSLITISTSNSERNLHLDLDGLLYIGGVRDTMWQSLPKIIKSRIGFEGCLASLDLNGETFNLVGQSDVLIPSTLVESGCSTPITRCSSTACANRGICVQLWNSYTCDCDLTTFSGPTCADGNESTAYQFGPNPGLISFTFDENNRPDTRNDLLALGFLTTLKDGALVRVDSATTADYFQLELIDGNILAVYNLGTEDIDIGDLGIKVNDGKYHIVRFTRSGQNSTLQIDNHNIITRSPSGKQLNIFNRHAFIQIGGHKNILRNSIEKPFIGIIAGLVFNGHRLLDMAAEDDPRIKTEGDLELMISIGNQQTSMTSLAMTPPSTSNNDHLNNQMLAEPKSPYANDDLIYSSAGSGCFDVNEDEECAHIANEGSGDELITPVYVSVNRFRPTPSSSFTNRNRGNNDKDVWRRPCQNEDDDDCMEGSGDKPPTSFNNNNRQYNYSNFDYYSSTSRPQWMTTWIPPTIVPINRPPYSPNQPPPWNSYNTPSSTNYDPYGNHQQQHYPIQRPKTTAPSWTKPVYSVNGPQRPIIQPPLIESQDPPEIYDVPLNIPLDIINNDTTIGQQPTSPDDPNQQQIPTEILTRANSERTVIIISAIAILLILVVVIGPIVLFLKVRYSANQSAYKIETFGPKMSATMPLHGSLSYQPSYNPVVRATSVSGITGHTMSMMGMMQQPMAPGVGMNTMSGRVSLSRPGTRPGTPTQDYNTGGGCMKKKDPHEWYV
uniref:Neurexin-1-like isoform X1 n=1 Tax=Dermatophagoides pteronyssinus TaxID=6956 RepID=A0A6P6YBA7_DERPT|nr:neurexin-1-like isoform X1 [Dermatophagoides pteronyssinus]